MFTPGRQGRRLALADRRPGAARLAADVPQRQREHQHRDDDRVAEVGGVAARDVGPAHAPALPNEDSVWPRNPAPPLGKLVGSSATLIAAGHHQRDQREVEPAQPQRRQPDQRAQHRRDQPGGQQHEREGQRRSRTPAARRPSRRARAPRSARARPGRRGPSAVPGRAPRPSRSRPPSRRRPSRGSSIEGSARKNRNSATMTATRIAVARSSRGGGRVQRERPWMRRRRPPARRPAREKETTRCRGAGQSRASVARTNGVMSRYWEIDEERRDERVDQPDHHPGGERDRSERSRAMSVAATVEITTGRSGSPRRAPRGWRAAAPPPRT